MKKENAIQYFIKGMQLLHTEKFEEAQKLFSEAIALNPHYAEAYQCRSQALSQLGRNDEAKADLQMVEEISTGKYNRDQNRANKVHKAHLEDISDDLTLHDDELDFEDDLFDYAFSDDSLESDDLLESLIAADDEETGIAAIVEYLNGEREEAPWTYLFKPTENELTLVQSQNNEEKIVSLEQLSCIRLSRVPSSFSLDTDKDCHVEVIETIDGNIYHELIHPEQNQKNVLFGFSTKEDTRFKYTLIPIINIKKRFQRRHLGQILLEKDLITDDVLKNALNEHNELKKIKFGKILAEKANLLESAVESEIQKAYTETKGKYKIGEILLNAGLVNEKQIQQALEYQKRLHNRKLGSFLIEKGILQEKDVCNALSEKFRIPFVDLRHQKGSKKVLSMLPRELILKLNVLPLAVKDNSLVVATLLPDPAPICEVILKHTSVKDVQFVLAQPSHLRNVIKVLFQQKK